MISKHLQQGKIKFGFGNHQRKQRMKRIGKSQQKVKRSKTQPIGRNPQPDPAGQMVKTMTDSVDIEIDPVSGTAVTQIAFIVVLTPHNH